MTRVLVDGQPTYHQDNDDNSIDPDAWQREAQQVLVPIGWLCPRCGKVNAPSVKQCNCEPGT